MAKKVIGLSKHLFVASKTGGKCAYCGRTFREDDKITIDHIDPKGGEGVDNLYIACDTCNTRKGNRNLEEFREYLIATLQKKLFTVYSQINKFRMYFKSQEAWENAKRNIEVSRIEIEKLVVEFYFERI